MTKKNLSDLLKEEAKTPVPVKSAAPADSAAQQTAAQKTSTNRSNSRVTKADLEKQVAQLEADLGTSRQQKDTLTKQVEGLKADLAKQQEHIFALKEAVEQAQSAAAADAEKLQTVTQELEEAKQVILKMTNAAEKTPEPQAPEPAQPKTDAKPALSLKVRPGGDIYRGSRRLPPPKPIPDYAIDHGRQSNSMLSNDEIGWVD